MAMRHDTIDTPSGEHGTNTSQALQQQAWAWLRLLTSRAASDTDVRTFRLWIDASPAHLAAYREVKAKWDALAPSAGLAGRGEAGLRASFRRRRTIKRRAFLGMAAATVSAAAVAAVRPPLGLWPAAGEWTADYRTDVGEQRSLTLGPGVAVTLNTRTAARREASHGLVTGLELLNGEAAIDLQDGRRFQVTAGPGRSEAEAGGFEVRYLDDKACVTCVAGTVTVTHPQGNRRLRAHEQVVYDTHAISAVAQADPDTVSAWRQGVLTFRRTRLADVIDEINRYRPGRVVLVTDSLRNQPVTGHFRIGALDQAIDQLQYTFDFQVRSLPGGLVLLS